MRVVLLTGLKDILSGLPFSNYSRRTNWTQDTYSSKERKRGLDKKVGRMLGGELSGTNISDEVGG